MYECYWQLLIWSTEGFTEVKFRQHLMSSCCSFLFTNPIVGLFSSLKHFGFIWTKKKNISWTFWIPLFHLIAQSHTEVNTTILFVPKISFINCWICFQFIPIRLIKQTRPIWTSGHLNIQELDLFYLIYDLRSYFNFNSSLLLKILKLAASVRKFLHTLAEAIFGGINVDNCLLAMNDILNNWFN